MFNLVLNYHMFISHKHIFPFNSKLKYQERRNSCKAFLRSEFLFFGVV